MRALNTSTGRPPIVEKFLAKTALFAVLFYAGSLYYASVIFNPSFAEPTRISEHALMPGVVNEKFDKDGRVTEILQGLQEHKSDRRAFLMERSINYGLNAYEQKWKSTVKISNASGTNVFAVSRAVRSPSTESILLAVDLADDEAVALGIAFMTYAREQLYWSRDLFLLLSDGGVLGMDAFLSQFHLMTSASIEAERLWERGEALLAAMVIKSSRSRSRSLEISVNQLNGALPNLDFFNSIVRIAGHGRYHLPTLLYGVKDSHEGGSSPYWLLPSRAMFTQAFHQLEGMHSVCAKYGVQGLSMSLPSFSVMPSRQSGRLIEAVTRALNNMLERFHQSYFLYVLADEDNFVSIAYFMPILGGVLAPLLLYGYRYWVFNLPTLEIPVSYWLIHGVGVAIWALSSSYFSMFPIVDSVPWIVLLGLIMFPWSLVLHIPSSAVPSIRFLLLLQASLLSASLGLLNFSLSLLCSIPAVPLILKLTQPNEIGYRRVIRSLICVLSHPLCLCLVWMVYGRSYLGYRSLSIESVSLDTVLSILRKLVKEHLLIGSHTYPLLLIVALPIWNLVLRVAYHLEETPKVKTD